jgi:hypothetical protein
MIHGEQQWRSIAGYAVRMSDTHVAIKPAQRNASDKPQESVQASTQDGLPPRADRDTARPSVGYAT